MTFPCPPACSNLSDDEKGERDSLPRINSESSVSSSAFATPRTCSGFASQPTTPPGDGKDSTLLASALEEKLLGLVGHRQADINGSAESDCDLPVRESQQGDCQQQFKSLLVRASSDSGVEEAQFTDDSHENESIGIVLSAVVARTERETMFFIGGDHPQSKSSASHQRTDSDLSAEVESGKASDPPSRSGLSDLLQQPCQLVSGASSPGDSFCSTSASSPAPSSPSPPPSPSLPNPDTRPDHRQPICVLANTTSSSPLSTVDGDTHVQPKEKTGVTVAPLPVLVRYDSAPVFPSLPSPISPGTLEHISPAFYPA